MASSVNVVVISGNLTRDPELRSTQGGTSILSFGVAVNDRVKNWQNGEWEDRPNFIDCVTFGRRADALADLMRKGMQVTVSGRLRWSQWETQDGSKRSKVEVVADSIVLPPRASGAQNRPANQQPQYAPSPAPSAPYSAPQAATGAPQYQQQYQATAPSQQRLDMPTVYDQSIPF